MTSQEFFGKGLEIVLEQQWKAREEAKTNKPEAPIQDNEAAYEQLPLEFMPPGNVKPMKDDEVGKLVSKIKSHSDYHRLWQEMNSIPSVVDRIAHINRFVYEHLPGNYAKLGVEFHQRLSDIGMPVLCPYLKLDGANTTTGQDCGLDKSALALCGGRADICKLYSGSNPSWPRVLARECLVDLGDLHDWWEGDGIYG